MEQMASRSGNPLKFWHLLLVFPIFIWAGEEDSRLSLKDLYLTPLEVILPEEIGKIESEERIPLDPESGVALREKPIQREGAELIPEETGPKTIDRKIKEAEGLLKRYYAQFLAEKRIWEERERGSIYSSRTEQNDIRLLLYETTHKISETYLVRESPILFELHSKLARYWIELEKPERAIRHFTAAYRYRSLSATEDFFRKGEWKNEDFRDSFKSKSDFHDQKFFERDKALKEFQKAKDDIHLLEAELFRKEESKTSRDQQLTTARNNIESKKTIYEQKEKEYQDSFKANYNLYLETRKREDSSNFFFLAKVVRKLEEENKERLKIINKSSVAGKGIFVLFDYKKNRDFFAYEMLLEKSYHLWPNNPEPIAEVAESFRQDGRKDKAIDFYDQLLRVLADKKGNLSDTEKELEFNSCLRLASLNADLKRLPLAGKFYEKYFLLSPDSDRKTQVAFEMGQFFLTKLGDKEKAAIFYIYWLERNSRDWNPSAKAQSKIEELESLAFLGLSQLERQKKNFEVERDRLLVSIQKFNELEKSRDLSLKKVRELQEQKLRVKKDLIASTEDEALSQYRILDVKIEDAQAELRTFGSRLKTIPITNIYFRLAHLYERDRDFTKADEAYDQVIALGKETEIDLALKDKKRIQRILLTGKIDPPFSESI